MGEVSVAYSGLFYQTTDNFESRVTPREFCYAVTLRFVIFKSFYVVYQALFMVHIFIMFSPALHVYKNNYSGKVSLLVVVLKHCSEANGLAQLT